MFRRVFVLSAILFVAIGTLPADEYPHQAELRFDPASNVERSAGIWVDGLYVGYVDEFNSTHRLLLLPGPHTIVVRQAWYKEFVDHVLLEPGKIYKTKLRMVRNPSLLPAAEANAELKISATPGRAAVFIDDQFLGHSDEFDGVGQAMLVTPGHHKLSIALPGYLPFEMVLNVRPYQKLRIRTDLQKGSITDAGPLVIPQ